LGIGRIAATARPAALTSNLGELFNAAFCVIQPLLFLVAVSVVRPGEPADGADGGDIVIVCDLSLESLLHLHKRKEWAGRRGAQGNPAKGSAGPKRNKDIKKASTAPLEIPVPPGTVIKRKGTGQVWVQPVRVHTS
jgi:GTPase involved in cell partitioning and DNA repair